MRESTLLKHFFNSRTDVDPQQQFGLNRKSRSKRLREIVSILRKHKFLQGFTPEQFRAVLEDLGPSFVKIGQTLSMRSEILPKAYRDALASLQTDSDPMPFDVVLTTLETYYGSDWRAIFTDIDPTPLGSASLAQVHKAVLKNGDVVVVKVQRPGVRATMAQDIDVMRSLARRGARFMKVDQMIDLRDVVEELWNTFLEETDFTREAENLEEFALLNKDVVYIRCPGPYLEYCKEEVLVMEYIDGIPISDTQCLIDRGYDLAEIGEKVLDNYATQILDHGFFHADPHPGNMVIKDGKIVYLDLGMMGRLNARDRACFGQIIEAVGSKSSSALKDALVSFSVSHDTRAVDHARFLSELDVIIDGYGSSEVSEIDIGALLSDIMVLAKQCRVQLPSSVTAVSRGIVTIEGTLFDFIGSFNIIDIINGHIMRTKTSSEDIAAALRDFAVALNTSGRGVLTAAEYSGDALRMLSRGQLKLNMEMLGSDEPLQKVSRIANRFVFGLIIAGLLVSASLITTNPDIPQVFGIPVLSFVEYVSAFVLSVIVVFDIYRRPK